MAGETGIGNGHRIGGQVGREAIAARLAARAAPLTTQRSPAVVEPELPTHLVTVAPPPGAGPSGDLVPLSPIRRRTAEHLRRSLSTAVHALVVTEVDYSAVDVVRRAHHLTYL